MTDDSPTDADHLMTLPLSSPPGGAIFDCDGTLADTMPLHFRAWCDALAPTGCPFPEEQFYEWGGVTAEEIVARLNALHGHTMDPAGMAHFKENLYRGLIPQVGPLAAIVDEARRLHGLGVPLAVASGGMRPMVEDTLDVLGIRALFPVVVAAEDVSRGKPDPEVFLLAAERIGVPAGECVVYEDSPAGLLAARRAGMRAVDVRLHLAPAPQVTPA
jgi:HAD superfamily hydrolase (TIGR01509 family)